MFNTPGKKRKKRFCKATALHYLSGFLKEYIVFLYNKVVDFTLHISEAGQEYNEKIEVDRNKQTELFQVPAHPGVDRSDTLHDFKKVSYLTCASFIYGHFARNIYVKKTV